MFHDTLPLLSMISFAFDLEKGNPGGVATTYSGTVTDFSNSDSVIYRPPLTGPDAKEYRLLRTEQDSRWLNGDYRTGSILPNLPGYA